MAALVGATGWPPLTYGVAVLWGLASAGLLLDARLRGRVGLMAASMGIVAGPFGAMAVSVLRLRAIRKVRPNYRGAPALALAIGVLGALAAVAAGTISLNRVAFSVVVPGRDMAPKISEGDRVLVSPLAFGTPHRGEVVAIKPFDGTAPLNRTGAVAAVLRIVGLPGEWVGVTPAGQFYVCARVPDLTRPLRARLPGEVVPRGEPDPTQSCDFPDETPYTIRRGKAFGPISVPEGAVWLLGDDRLVGDDSRAFGAVPLEFVAGRVVATLWPPRRVAVR